jgi:brefeldin A-inhibited guanine nucleotide-exchange protein
VFSISFSIFTILVEKFREHLKTEIAAFFETVFLKILDSLNSSYNHILYTLNVFKNLFCNPRITLDFYVNYDCVEDNPFLA